MCLHKDSRQHNIINSWSLSVTIHLQLVHSLCCLAALQEDMKVGKNYQRKTLKSIFMNSVRQVVLQMESGWSGSLTSCLPHLETLSSLKAMGKTN